MSNSQHFRAVKEKAQSRKGLDLNDVKILAPSAFTESISPEMRKQLNITDKYVHIPTSKVIEDVQKLGWLPIDASETRTNRSSVKGYKRHMVKFINPDIPQDTDEEQVEMLLINSHDGKSSFRFEAGIFRMVCSNGLVIKSNDMGSLNIRHMWYDFSTLQDTIKDISEKVPDHMSSVSRMKGIHMTKDDMESFASQSALMRFPTQNVVNIKDIVDIENLLTPVRKEDEDNTLWNTFNRVQEKIINGNFTYHIDKERKARAIKGLQSRLKINQDMWELADQWV